MTWMSASTGIPWAGRAPMSRARRPSLTLPWNSIGQTAHAAFDPWNGRSAVDGLELFTTGLNFLREHLRPTVRIHYHIQHAGEVVNVVPDYARVWTRIRDAKRDDMLEIYERVKTMVEGAAMMADVESKITLVSGLHEVVVNRTGGMAMQKNLEILGPIQYTEEEIAFAKKIQAETGKPRSAWKVKYLHWRKRTEIRRADPQTWGCELDRSRH